jgi:alkyl hydroperoxide reductase subunit AhpF
MSKTATIANERAVLADSLSTATANSSPDRPALRGEAEADVVVIGGGFTGLSAALHLAERGVDVVLLEAELGFPVTEAHPIPFHRFRRIGVGAPVALFRALDLMRR